MRRHHDASADPRRLPGPLSTAPPPVARVTGAGPVAAAAGQRKRAPMSRRRRNCCRCACFLLLVLLSATISFVVLLHFEDVLFDDADDDARRRHADQLRTEETNRQQLIEMAWPQGGGGGGDGAERHDAAGRRHVSHVAGRDDSSLARQDQAEQDYDGGDVDDDKTNVGAPVVGAGLVVDPLAAQVVRMEGHTRRPLRDVAAAIAQPRRHEPLNMFGVGRACDAVNDDEAEDELRMRTACLHGTCGAEGAEEGDEPAGEVETPFIPEAVAKELATHGAVRVGEGDAPPTPPADGDDADLEAMLNIFRLYGRLFNLTLEEEKFVSTTRPVTAGTEVERVNVATMSWYTQTFLHPDAQHREAQLNQEDTSPRTTTTTTPLHILESYYTAPDDAARFAVSAPPTPAEQRADAEGANSNGAGETQRGRKRPPLLAFHEDAARENLFAINAEAERQLIDDGYAAANRNRVPRSNYFFDPFHLSRRGYGTEASIFVALVPLFAEANSANVLQRKSSFRRHGRDRGAAAGGGGSGGDAPGSAHARRGAFASPAHKRTIDGQIPVEAVYNTLQRDASRVDAQHNLFSTLFTHAERDGMLVDGLESRRTACAAALESLYANARWPLSVFTGVMEVVLRREYTAEEEKAQEKMEAQLRERWDIEEEALQARPPAPRFPNSQPPSSQKMDAGGVDGAGGTRSVTVETWRPVRVNGTTLPPRASRTTLSPGTRAVTPLDSEQRSTYHVLYSCVSDSLTRQASEESFGFAFKDNIRTRRMVLPQNAHKQRHFPVRGATANTKQQQQPPPPPQTPSPFTRYNDGTVFTSLSGLMDNGGGDAAARGKDGPRPPPAAPDTRLHRDLPFSSEYGTRLSLLKLYKGETYVMFLRVQERVGGTFASALLRAAGGLNGFQAALHRGALGKQPMIVYETFATAKTFKRHWDWTLRLHYLSLPDKDRAILSTRARDLHFVLTENEQGGRGEADVTAAAAADGTAPAAGQRAEASNAPQQQQRVAAEGEKKYVSADFPLFFASALRQVMREEAVKAAAEARLRTGEPNGPRTRDGASSSLEDARDPQRREFDLPQFMRQVGSTVPAAMAQVTALTRRRLDCLHLVNDVDSVDVEDSGGADREKEGEGERTDLRRAMRQRARLEFATAHQLFTPQFAFDAFMARREAERQHEHDPRHQQQQPTGQPSAWPSVASFMQRPLAEKLNFLLGGAADGGAAPPPALSSSSAPIQLSHEGGLTSREVVEVLYPLALTEDQWTHVHATYCNMWLMPTTANRIGNATATLSKRHAEFCFLFTRRNAILSAMSELLFTSSSAPRSHGAGAKEEAGAVPIFIVQTADGTLVGGAHSESNVTAADAVPILLPEMTAAPKPNHVDGPAATDTAILQPAVGGGMASGKMSVMHRLLQQFFPPRNADGRPQAGVSADAAVENTLPAFAIGTRLVPREADALSDMSFFTIKDDNADAVDEDGDGDTAEVNRQATYVRGRRGRGERLVDRRRLRLARTGRPQRERSAAAPAPSAPASFLTNVISGDFLFARAEAFFNMSRELQSIFSEAELLAAAGEEAPLQQQQQQQGRGDARRSERGARRHLTKDLIDAIGDRNAVGSDALIAVNAILQHLLQEEEEAARVKGQQPQRSDGGRDEVTTAKEDKFQRHCGRWHEARSTLAQLLSVRNVRGAAGASPSSASPLAETPLSAFYRAAPESVYLDPFLFFLTSDENDLLLSALLWTSGWNFFAPSENVLFTVHFAAPTTNSVGTRAGADAATAGHVDSVSEERVVLLRQATVRRWRKMLELRFSPTPPVLLSATSSTSKADATNRTAAAEQLAKQYDFAEMEAKDVYFMGCHRSLRAYWQFAELDARFDQGT